MNQQKKNPRGDVDLKFTDAQGNSHLTTLVAPRLHRQWGGEPLFILSTQLPSQEGETAAVEVTNFRFSSNCPDPGRRHRHLQTLHGTCGQVP